MVDKYCDEIENEIMRITNRIVEKTAIIKKHCDFSIFMNQGFFRVAHCVSLNVSRNKELCASVSCGHIIVFKLHSYKTTCGNDVSQYTIADQYQLVDPNCIKIVVQKFVTAYRKLEESDGL